ncbi:hypothetical protein Bca101_099082 [Brassica carinata]
MWRRIGPENAPRRLGCKCGGALAVSEAEKVRTFREVSRSQNTLGIQAVVMILIYSVSDTMAIIESFQEKLQKKEDVNIERP